MPVANTGPNHPTGETTLATGSRNERTQLAEQLKVAVLEIWQNAASDDVARLGFGLDAPERIKFWNRMRPAVDVWCLRHAQRILRTAADSPAMSDAERSEAIRRAEQRILDALIDAALVEILNRRSLGCTRRARELLWDRHEEQVHQKAEAFERSARWRGEGMDLCQSAYLHIFQDKAEGAEDPQVRRKGEARVRRYRPLYEGDADGEETPHPYATLTTFLDHVLRNLFIQLTRTKRLRGKSKKRVERELPPDAGGAMPRERLVDRVLDRLMQHPKSGACESGHNLRSFLQNQSAKVLRRAAEDDSALLALMNLIPGIGRQLVGIPDRKRGEDSNGRWEDFEWKASADSNRRHLQELRNAEIREVLADILARLRKAPPSGRRRSRKPLNKVNVFEQHWWHEMTLKDIVAEVKRSIGSVSEAITEIESKIKDIIRREYPELAQQFAARRRGPGSPS